MQDDNQLKRSFNEASLNELGELVRFWRRERVVTPPQGEYGHVERFTKSSMLHASSEVCRESLGSGLQSVQV